MSSKAVKLRAHHGMCLAYFVGEGYSQGFAAHMAQVLASLTPETPVQLAAETDAVCAGCPNNLGGACEKRQLVESYDRAVLARCGLEEGTVVPFGTFTALVQKRILAPGGRQEICGSCQWSEICDTQPSRWAAYRPAAGLSTHPE